MTTTQESKETKLIETPLIGSESVSKLRAMVKKSETEIRNIVIWGGFATLGISTEWKMPSFKLLVFVSSTFTDTQLERNYLMDELLFQLRTHARPYGIEVIFMDMRWGVRDENTLDHKTWVECGTGIYWCKKESLGICFLSLQADKYGYTPLPRTLLKTSLDSHVDSSDCDEETRKLLAHWYILDENACPPVYLLRSLESPDDVAYWAAYEKMLDVLRGLEFDTEKHIGLLVGRSVTEWEVRAALGPYPVELSDRGRSLLWSQRPVLTIDDPESKELRGFNDTIDNSWKNNYMAELKSFMTQEFPADNSITTFKTPLNLTDLCASSTAIEHQKEYLAEFKESMSSHLHQSLLSVISQQEQWALDGSGLGLSGDVLSEILHHSQWAHAKCQTFYGREHLIEQVIQLIDSPHRKVEKRTDKYLYLRRFQGVAASVVGVSGAGKTALMAKIASVIYIRDQENKSRAVLVRFCGTSPGSRNARSLMISLIAQIEYLFNVEDRKSTEELSNYKYEKVVSYFHRLLKEHPVLLFIDSLDQLTDQDLGRSEISFLKKVKPHPDTRIIVSCLPDEFETTEMKSVETRRYLYLCETRLKEAEVPRVEVQMSSDEVKAKEEVMGIVRHLLSQQGRTLSERQWAFVGNRVMEETEKTALYTNLAVRVVSKWTSETDPTEGERLAGGVRLLILQLFDTLERDYGQLLVQKALGFITFSVKGVTDTEMEDLLSLDEEVLDFVFQYAQRSIRRLPTHMWLRLKGALEGLVVEGEGGCQVWYHRQLRETAEDHLKALKVNSHKTMALYFGNLVTPETLEEKKLFEHRWVLSTHESAFETGVVYNRRRCEEVSHHLMECGMLEEVERELCSLEGIFCKIQVGLGFQLIIDLIKAEQLLKESGSLFELEKRVNHYYRWLRRDIYIINKEVCSNLALSAMNQTLKSSVHQDNFTNLDNLLNNPNFESQLIRCISMGKIPTDFSYLVASLEGHSSQVNTVAYSFERSQTVSGSDDTSIKLWDISVGSLLKTFEGHSDNVLSVAFNHDGSLIVSGSVDKSIKVWNCSTGSLLKTIAGHSKSVSSVAFNHDSSLILSGSKDNSIKIWDCSSGSLLKTFKGHNDSIFSVVFNHNGSQIASGSRDKSIKLWCTKTGSLLKTLEGHRNHVLSVAFNHDGSLTVSGSEDKSIIVWDSNSGSLLKSLAGHSKSVNSVAFNHDSSLILSGSKDNSIKIWDCSSGSLLKTFEGHSDCVSSVAFNNLGSQIISGSWDNSIKIWDSNGESTDHTSNSKSSNFSSVAFNHDGSLVVSGSFDKTIKIWNTKSRSLLKTLDGYGSEVNSVAFSHEGSLIVSGSNDKSIKVWDSSTGSLLKTLEGHSSFVLSVAFNHDGSQIVSGSKDYTIKLWEIHSGSVLKTFEDHDGFVNSVAFNHDGSQIVSGSKDKLIIIWDRSTGCLLKKMKGHSRYVNTVAFNHDGSQVVSGSDDKSIKLWDSNTGSLLKTLEGHSSYVSSVAFNHDGSQVVSGSWDKTIRIWDCFKGSSLKTLKGRSNIIFSVAFSRDGKQIIFGSEDASVIIWFL